MKHAIKLPISLLLENRINKREFEDFNIQAQARRYALLTTPAPPIRVRRGDYWILDGHNRTLAAIYRGETSIDAVMEDS